MWPPLGSCSCGKPNKRLQGEDIFGNIISKDSNLLQTLLGSLTSRPDRLCVKLEGKRHNQSKSHQRRTSKNHFSCQSHLEVGSTGIHVVKLSAIVVHPGKENCNSERSAKRMVTKRIKMIGFQHLDITPASSSESPNWMARFETAWATLST